MGSDPLITPVYGERALLVDKTLVVADLHIGLEQGLRLKGASVPSQGKKIEKGLTTLLEDSGAEELIILGDVKHNIPSISIQEYKDIPLLMRTLSDLVSVSVVKGNHDGNLEKLMPRFRISEYLVKEGVLYVHGHSWIKTKSIDEGMVVLGHSHPAVAFSDKFSGSTKEPAWIRGRFNSKIKERYDVKGKLEFIVIPAFNPLISGTPVNRRSSSRLLGPWLDSEIIDLKRTHAYLLDGTDLGSLKDLEAT